MPLIIVGHGAGLAGFERQAGLGAVERLDLRLLVDREHHGVGRRVHVEADDILDLLGQGRASQARTLGCLWVP
jgi:hypothetical protein